MSNERNTRITQEQQVAMYYMRKRNRLRRKPLDTAPLTSADYIQNWGGTPAPIVAASEGGDVRVGKDDRVRVTKDGRIRVVE